MKYITLTRSVLLSTFILGALLGVAPSSADAKESPQYGHLALKLGIYRPDIDKEFKNATPYKDYFGSDYIWLFETELGVNLYKGFGIFGVSMHAGYGSISGKVKIDENSTTTPAPKPTPGTGTTTKEKDKEAPDTTSFSVIPLYLSLFYTFDYLATEFNIPFTLTVDGGITYTPWYIDGANGKTSSFQGKSGKGGTWGWRGSARLSFLLDIIDENTAALFDLSWGVNNSYLFAEFVYSQADNFGKGNVLNLSDAYAQFGLSFDF